MGQTTVSDIINRAAQSLGDPMMSRWSEDDLKDYLSDAQRAAVLILPEVNTVNRVVALVPGTTQELPEDAYRLIDVVCNRTAIDGNAGRVVRAVERSILDQSDPNWHTGTASTAAKQFVYDIRNRKAFYVEPPQPDPADGFVEIVYARIPAEITDDTETIEIDDIYVPALMSWMLYLAHLKDVGASKNQQAAMVQAQGYATMFQFLLLGREDDQELSVKIANQILEGDNSTQRITQ